MSAPQLNVFDALEPVNLREVARDESLPAAFESSDSIVRFYNEYRDCVIQCLGNNARNSDNWFYMFYLIVWKSGGIRRLVSDSDYETLSRIIRSATSEANNQARTASTGPGSLPPEYSTLRLAITQSYAMQPVEET